jgi:hypothetical protein
VAAFCARIGYRGFFVSQGELMPIDRFEAAAMQRADDVPAATASLADRRSSRYVNNFLFLPRPARAALLAALDDELARCRTNPA